VQVYVPLSAAVRAGFLISEVSGVYSLLLESIDTSVAGNSSATLDILLSCLLDCEINGYCCGNCLMPPGIAGGAKLKLLEVCGVVCEEVEYAEMLSLLDVAMLP
jgi:hypothetical protein